MNSTCNQWAEAILKQQGHRVTPEAVQYVSRRLLDFYCVLHEGKTFLELKNGKPAEVLALTSLLKEMPYIDPEIAGIYETAVEKGHSIAQAFRHAVAREPRLDRRKTKDFQVKLFLYLNWEFAVMIRICAKPLREMKNTQLADLLSRLPEPVAWSEDDLRQALHRLNLKRDS